MSAQDQYPRPTSPEEVLTGDVFRIGDPEKTLDLQADDRFPRRLLWVSVERQFPELDDIDVCGLAGWSDMVYWGRDDEFSELRIPEGTRSAASVLGGVEAWAGEKAEFLAFMSNYINQVRAAFNGITDTSVRLDTVARTKDGQYFITPPHTLNSGGAEVENWKLQLEEELRTVLSGEESEEQTEHLVSSFLSSIDPPNGSGRAA